MNIAIIGAGISGLAASHELTKLGHQVTIYEASNQPGGRGQLLNRPNTDDWADVGTQYFHSNYKRGLKLIDELGLSDQLKKIEGNSRYYTDTDGDSFLITPRLPYIKPGGIWGNIKLVWYVLKLVIFYRLKVFDLEPQEKLDRIAGLDSTSNQFIQDYIVRMLVIVGGLSEPNLHKVNTLQVLRLIRIILMTDYVSLKGGTASLHAVLAGKADIKFNSAVESLILNGDKVSGIQLCNGESVAADHVIVAAHAPQAAALTPAEWTEEKSFLTGIDMPSTIIVSFFLDRSMEKGVWSHFMPINTDGPVTFGVDTQQKNPRNTPSGKATFQAWITSPKAADLFDKTDHEIIAAAQQDMQRYLPEFSNWIETAAVTKHKHAVPQSSVGHNQRAIDFLEAIDKREGISYCGDYFSGGYLECALWSVERMVKKLG